jgi:hypothetical protein
MIVVINMQNFNPITKLLFYSRKQSHLLNLSRAAYTSPVDPRKSLFGQKNEGMQFGTPYERSKFKKWSDRLSSD